MSPNILFATPMYGGGCTEPFFHSALRISIELGELDLDFDWLTERNESLVHRARMEMAATFLRSPEFTHLFWIDGDIEFTADDVAAVWNLGADVAVGVYPMKKPGAGYAAWVDGALVKDLDQFAGPIEVDYAGTGFMLVERAVIEALATKVPSFEGKGGERVPGLFQTPIENGMLWSEDYFFCRLAREHGFRVVMDPRVRLKHWGMHAYGEAADIDFAREVERDFLPANPDFG